MKLIIQGDPVAKHRHRMKFKKVKKPHSYKDQEKQERDFTMQVLRQFNIKDQFPKGVPLYMDFSFFIKRPKSHYRAGKNSHLLKRNSPILPCTSSTSDLDNYVKFVKDCLNSLVYHDDCQVTHYGLTRKVYDKNSRVEVVVTEIVQLLPHGTVLISASKLPPGGGVIAIAPVFR